jgi:hypothetical protein
MPRRFPPPSELIAAFILGIFTGLVILILYRGISYECSPMPERSRFLPRKAYWRSGVCAVVQKPFSLFSCHKLLVAFLAYRGDARRRWASSDCVFGVTQRTAEVSTWQRSSTVRVALKHLLENSPSLAGQSAAAHFD